MIYFYIRYYIDSELSFVIKYYKSYINVIMLIYNYTIISCHVSILNFVMSSGVFFGMGDSENFLLFKSISGLFYD